MQLNFCSESMEVETVASTLQNNLCFQKDMLFVLIDFSLTVKATTLIFTYGRGSAISSA